MIEFGESKGNFLNKFLKLPYDIPSKGTFDRVFSIIDSQ